jgi:HK97 family phage major capsid protein/HK97 family phage prohead protease
MKPNDDLPLAERQLTDPIARRAAAAQVPSEGAIIRRAFALERGAIDVEKRTVELAFSSDLPYERWFGTEILDHSPQAIDLSRLNSGGALLLNHDIDQQIGVVEIARVDSDHKGRASVRFSRSAKGEEIFQDVQDGIRRLVSVAYRIHELKLESSSDAEDVYRVTKWEPFEVSIVAVPADPTVGVGRALQSAVPQPQEKQMPQEPVAPAAAAAAVDTSKIIADARQAELERGREINAIGAQFKCSAEAEAAISAGKSVDEFRKEVLGRVHADAVKRAKEASTIGLSDGEVKRFSFVRLMHAIASPDDRGAQEAAAYEREVSDAARAKSGKPSRGARGFMVPMDVLAAPMLQRDLTVGTSTAGGHTVSTDLLSGSFIDILRKRMVLQRAGATFLDGLVGNIAIPRHTTASTAYWVAENTAPTESNQAFDQVTMSPKTVGTYVDYSRKLLLQSSIGVENFVRGDLTRVIGLGIDLAGLYGTGSANQPTGVKNQSGINTKDFAAAAPTFAEIVALETLVADDNADAGTLAYLVNSTGRGGMKTTEKASSTGQFIWEPGNTVNGYRCEVSNQVAAGDFWFGNWADLVIGMWSGLDITVDPYTASNTGAVRIVALQDVDVCVRHPESFCRGADTL